MSKYEQVTDALECVMDIDRPCNPGCEYFSVDAECDSVKLCRDCLELLKEYEVLKEQNAKLIRQKEARFQPVRCKDCFHKLEIDGKCYCDKPSENIIRFKDPNWYCADGIPKKET